MPGSATLSVNQHIHGGGGAAGICGVLRRLMVKPSVSQVHGKSYSAQQCETQRQYKKHDGLACFIRVPAGLSPTIGSDRFHDPPRATLKT